jgi:hypothetical protein
MTTEGRGAVCEEDVALFGMLDYRAHKLLWLICLPFNIVAKIGFYVVVAVAITIAQSTSYSLPVKIGLAWLTMEGIALILFQVIFALMFWAIRRGFFWLIDVIPDHGTDAVEAQAIVLRGRAFELEKKFLFDIGNWTYDDTFDYVSRINWRARLLFPVRERALNVIEQLQRIYGDTGKQPGDFETNALSEIREGLPYGHVSWFEKAITSQPAFNSIVGFVISVIVLSYFAS